MGDENAHWIFHLGYEKNGENVYWIFIEDMKSATQMCIGFSSWVSNVDLILVLDIATTISIILIFFGFGFARQENRSIRAH